MFDQVDSWRARCHVTPWLKTSTASVIVLELVFLLTPACAESRNACEALSQLSLPEVTSVSASDVSAGPFIPSGNTKPAPGGDLPAFCRVHITVSPQINIEVWLPTATWNGRYRGEGGGYYVGSINYDSMADGLRKGYATASTDTGHHYTPSELTDRARFGAIVGAFALKKKTAALGKTRPALLDRTRPVG